MKKPYLLLVTMLSLLITACAHSQLSSDSEYKYESLTQGPEQWKNIYAYGEAKFIDNEIRLISTGNWFYLTKKQYKNFILEAEIFMPNVQEYSNSGIIFRSEIKDTNKGSQAVGYQAEVDVSERKWSGGLYEQGGRQWLHPLHKKSSYPDEDFLKNLSIDWNNTKANAFVKNEWNKYRIECKDSEIKIYLNNILTTHVIDVKKQEGYIGIQHHGSAQYTKTGNRDNTIRFRNINIAKL